MYPCIIALESRAWMRPRVRPPCVCVCVCVGDLASALAAADSLLGGDLGDDDLDVGDLGEDDDLDMAALDEVRPRVCMCVCMCTYVCVCFCA